MPSTFFDSPEYQYRYHYSDKPSNKGHSSFSKSKYMLRMMKIIRKIIDNHMS